MHSEIVHSGRTYSWSGGPNHHSQGYGMLQGTVCYGDDSHPFAVTVHYLVRRPNSHGRTEKLRHAFIWATTKEHALRQLSGIPEDWAFDNWQYYGDQQEWYVMNLNNVNIPDPVQHIIDELAKDKKELNATKLIITWATKTPIVVSLPENPIRRAIIAQTWMQEFFTAMDNTPCYDTTVEDLSSIFFDHLYSEEIQEVQGCIARRTGQD